MKISILSRFCLCLLVLGGLCGCQQTMDSYFNELINPGVAAQKQAALARTQIRPHESWCYRTLAEADCYIQPQSGAYDRLEGVDPPNLMPQSKEEYGDALLAAAAK